MTEVTKITDGMHPSHISKGYFILKVGNLYYPFCKSIMIGNNGYKDYDDCVKSFSGKL